MRLAFRFILLLLLALWVTIVVRHTAFSAVPLTPVAQRRQAVPLSSATPAAPNWLIVPNLPATATEADYGAEVYRLVCEACHGAERLGLTAEWLASWPPTQQNCWQSKCHAPNHPPDGFDLPRYVPALSGPTALRRFATALDLYEYIRNKMPYQNPGTLTDEQYWQLTAFLVREQGIVVTSDLNHQRTSALNLHPDAALTTQPDAAPSVRGSTTFWWAIVVASAAIVTLTFFLLYGRHSDRKDPCT